jgi:ferritin-like metal-binding protein YciE
VAATVTMTGSAFEGGIVTRYGTLIAWAKQLGHTDCVSLLQQTLGEEEATDKKLTVMAERRVNPQAACGHLAAARRRRDDDLEQNAVSCGSGQES